MTIRCNANLFRIASLCQSSEETRYYLCGVYVEPHHAGGVTLTTTDGHRLLCIRDESGFADESAIIQLSADAIRACKGKKFETRTLIVDGLDATVYCSQNAEELGLPVAISAKCRVDGTFPDYRRVVPKDYSQTVSDAFAGEFLASFGAIAGELARHFEGTSKSKDRYERNRSDGLRIVSGEIGAPSFVLFEKVENAFGLIMPTSKPGNSRGAPEWFRAPVKPETAIAA